MAQVELLRQPKGHFAVAVLISRAQAPLLIVGFMDQQNGGEE
jgi:CO dehydrogenase/acetyl-CoA synthase epsilon subunit